MAENYGTLEGTLDEHGVLSGEMSDRATLEGEIQFGSGGGGVLDVFQNGQSVVQGRYAYVTVPTFLKDLRSDDYHNTVTTLEIQNWNGKADPSDIPTALSQLDNDANYVQDADYVHTDNNFTNEDKAAIGNIPENITDLSDVAVDNIQNGQVLKWDATQEKFVNADESGGGSGDVADVKVNGTSVVDPVTKEANIDLTDYAKTEDIPTDLADLSDDATHRLVTDTEKDTWDSKSDFSGDYNDLDNLPTLGTAAAKNSTALITSGSTDVAEAGAVRDAIDSAVSSSYHHAGTKTCAELVSSLLVRANEGNVYNMTDSGVTTADFIEGAGKSIEEGANVGIAKIAENTYKFDLLSGFVDTSTFIEKSATSGLVRNDGSIDENDYALESDIPDISGKANKSEMSVATSGDQTTIQLKNGTSATVINQHQDISGKVDKDGDKVLSDNNYTDTDKDKVATIGNKADKVTNATNGNLAGLNGSGNLTDSGWNGAKDTTSISGNPISISGLKANQLAVNPIITLEPIQAGSGTPSPSNVRTISGYDKVEVLSCGKNILPLTLEDIKFASLNSTPMGTWSGNTWNSGAGITVDVQYDDTNNVSGLKVNGTATTNVLFFVARNIKVLYKQYTLSGCPSGGAGDTYRMDARNMSTTIDVDTGDGVTFLSTQRNDGYVLIRVQSGFQANNLVFKPQLEESTIKTTFAPYVKTTDLSESLGQTVYGGTLDVRTGVLMVTHRIVDLGSIDWDIVESASAYKDFRNISMANVIKPVDSQAIANGVCEIFAMTSRNDQANNHPLNTIAITLNGYIRVIANASYTDATAFKTDMSGVYFVYELATPFYIQLTPHEISLLKDYAYVSTNGTTIALDYHNGELASLSDVAQLNETLERKVLRTEGHAYSTSEQIVGTWIDGKPIYENIISLDRNISGASWVQVPEFNDLKIENCIEIKMLVAGGMTYVGFFDYTSTPNEIWINRAATYTDPTFILQYTKTTD